MRENTRVSEDLFAFYERTIATPSVEEENVNELLGIFREKFDLDVVYVCTALADTHTFRFCYLSTNNPIYNDGGKDISVDPYEYEAIMNQCRENGLFERIRKQPHIDIIENGLHFAVIKDNEWEGSIGFLAYDDKRKWTDEEKTALIQLERVLYPIIFIERYNTLKDLHVRMQQQYEEEYLRYQEVLQALSNDFGAIFYVSLDKNQAIPYRIHPNYTDDFPEEIGVMFPYKEHALEYMHRNVVSYDQPSYTQKIEPDFIRQVLKNNEAYAFDFGSKHNNKLTHYRLKMVRANSSNRGVHDVVLGFANVDFEYERDRRQQELMKEHMNIIAGLCQEYSSIFLIDPKLRTLKLFRTSGEFTDVLDVVTKSSGYDISLDDYIATFVHAKDRKNVYKETRLEYIQERLQKIPCHYVNFRRIIDGVEDYAQLSYTPVESRDGSLIIVLAVRSVNDMVEKELAQQSLLQNALAQAKLASKAKSSFLSNMSHDIRTPINAIVGYTSLAISHLDDKEQVANYLEKVTTSSNHLLELINDILEISRIESGKVKLHKNTSNIETAFLDIADMVSSQAKEKNIELTVFVDVWDKDVYFDKLRMNQALLNLLSNAIKYTPSRGSIEFTLRQIKNRSKKFALYEIRVKDNGIGMSKEFLNRIFEPFEREQTTEMAGIQGTGLGLAITKNILDLAGAKIEVKSSPGLGTEFIILVEFRVSEDAEEIPHEEVDKSNLLPLKEQQKHILAGKHILLAEDNQINAEITIKILTESGMKVAWAKNGQEVVERFSQSSVNYYDAILMDIRMPIMNGYDATKRIRNLARIDANAIPIIALSADAFEEDIRRSIKKGMTAHISKPITVGELMSTLEQSIVERIESKNKKGSGT